MKAEDAFKGGFLTEAGKFYTELGDWPMVLLCGYILGDEELLKQVLEKGEQNAMFRAAVLLQDEEEIKKMLTKS